MGKRAKMTVLVTLLASFTGLSAADGAEPGLVGWWQFEGDTLDSSGNNRAGTLVGNAGFAAGLYGQALTMDGSGDYMRVDGYTGITGSNPFSITAWVRTTAANDRTMVNWGTNTNGQRVDFRLFEGRLRVEHGNGNLQGGTLVNDNEWHHVALVVGPDAPLQAPDVGLYLDGRNDTQTTTDPDKFNIVANVPVTIGQRRTNNDRAFLGLLDEVRIYDRVLTADEIKAMVLHPKAYAPSPADGALDVGSPLFTWKARETAQWHNVYLGTDPNLGPGDLVASRIMTALYWHVPGLVSGQTYYWRVDEIELDETVYAGDVWSFVFTPKEAWMPVPGDGEPYMDPNVTPTWKAGLNALSHDVYFGTDKTAVAEGTGDTFKGNQLLTTFSPGLLASDTTYFWRIDAVAVDGTKTKGNLWTFKTLPVIAVADPNLVAWWTLDEGAGTRAVDWSGHGHHATFIGGAQWAPGYDGAALGPCASGQYVEATGYPGVLGTKNRTTAAWIRTTTTGDILSWGLQTDTQKWNFRVQSENGTVGAIRVECQGGRIVGWTDVRDGEWHHVAAVLESSGAPTTLDIKLYVDGVQEAISDSLSVAINTTAGARSVRFGDGHQNRPFPGPIDDVRIYDKALSREDIQAVMRIDPLRAWQQQPKNGAIVDIRTATPLTWTEGDKASKHDVYFGIDAAAVAAADAADGTGIYRGRLSATEFTPSEDLEWGRKYFWRVDEVNTDGSITAGKVWAFTVADYLIVDDFEGYTDDDGSRIYQTWIDGYADGSSGSTVGNLVAPFGERTVIHGGEQAMPMDYNNINSPWFSEAERSWDKAQNWTFGGVNTLVVHFRGEAPAFVETAADAITLTAAGWDIWHDAALTRFDECRFAYKRLTGDGTIVVRVDSIMNTNAWAKGGVMIRESLDWASRHASVFVTPGQGVAFQRRLANSDAGLSTAQAAIVAPHWVKLTRTGDLFTAQHSDDGVTWSHVVHATSPTSDTVMMSGTVYIGLALTSHAPNVACTAQFSAIQTTGNVSGAWQTAEIGVDHPGNAPAKLYVTVEDSTGKKATMAHPDPAATLLTDWQAWSIDLAGLTGVKASAVKRLYIGVGDRQNPVAGGAGRLYIDDIRITRGVPVEPNAVP